MAGAPTAWGLDVGRCALKAVKLRAGENNAVELVAYDYIEHAKILSQPDADRAELFRGALEKFLSRNDISKDGVVVSVPGQSTLARFTKLPPVAPKRIPDLVRFEADQQIPFDMDEVIWDYQTFQQSGLPDLEVGIFAMKRELLREHLLHYEQVAIEPIAVQSTPLAVYNAAHFDGLLGKETTILLDIGAENTDLIIATPDTFWTRTVPIGGNTFSQSLVKSFKLSFAKAENLKRTADSSKYARQIFQAMRPVFADLVQELQRSIGFYASTHRDAKVEKVVGVGNAFRLPGLRKYLQQNLGMPVERLDSFHNAKLVSREAGRFQQEVLSFAAAYGLALQGLDRAKVTSNLLPGEIAKQIVWRRKRPWFGAAAACLLLAGVLIWFRHSADMRALTASANAAPPRVDHEAATDIIVNGPSPTLPDRALAQAVFAAGDFLRKELNSLSGQGATERNETETLLRVQHNKVIVPRLLQVIHESLPEGALLSALSAEGTGQAAVANPAPAGPRSQRQEVYVDRLYMHYEPNVNEYEWSSMVEVPAPINDPSQPLGAIKIEITCRTPYQGGLNQPFASATEFISKTFMDTLRTKGRQPNRGFYLDRVYLYRGNKVEIAGGVAGRSASARPPTGTFGRGTAGTRGAIAPVASEVNPESLDPLTNEPMDNDWEFVIWADAVLEDYPQGEEG